MRHLLHGVKSLPKTYNPAQHRNAFFYHYLEELDDELLPSKWYESAYPELVKSAHILKNVDQIDGRLTNIEDGSTIIDDQIDQEMQTFKSLARAFIGAPSMGDQIISSYVCFLAETTYSSSESDSPSWMRLASTRVVDSPPSRKWGDILEMFDDLIKYLTPEQRLTDHVTKLEALREELYQIKEVSVERDIGYREARHQERLVQKKLTQTLGHSSKCLFTLLLYYLYGSVRDIEVDVCGGVYGRGSGSFYLCIRKVLTSDGEKILRNGIKQLDRALGLFKFVWESAGMKGVLELQSHVWCMRAKERTLTYRGNVFFVHGIRF